MKTSPYFIELRMNDIEIVMRDIEIYSHSFRTNFWVLGNNYAEY